MDAERTRIGWSSWLIWVLAVTVGSSIGTALAHDVFSSLLGRPSFVVEEVVHGQWLGRLLGPP